MGIFDAEFDPVKQFIKAKLAYERKQGSVTSTKFAYMAYPKTTWAQVAAFYALWLDYTNVEKCQQRLLLYSDASCRPKMTPSYVRALADFERSAPRAKASGSDLAAKIRSGEIYPWNDDFWGYGRKYAIELSSTVSLPTPLDIAVDSLAEAVKEAPGTIGNALAFMDPSKLLPDMPISLGAMMMWSAVALGAWAAYKMWKKDQEA